jgi:RNA polymerase sigma-54 factor
MGMADLAEALGVHVSTISRVVAGATLDAPTGVLWLRRMFSGARRGKDNDAPPQAVAALRHRLSRIIATENRAKPLSDAALVVRLAEDSGVTLARRTIAQYREAEGIPPAYRRRLRVMTTRKRIAAPKANQD